MPSEVAPAPPVNTSFYRIRPAEKEFFKQATGINDDEELKKHIFEIQAKAYSVFPYPCVRAFAFIFFQLCPLPRYKEILKLSKERPDAIYLEIGCAFGTDLRKLVADGYPLENVVASDLHGEYNDLGHQLFRTTPETYPVAFIPGDIFELVSEPQAELASNNGAELLPPLRTLTSLALLQGRVSVIHASSLFHLFPPEKQQKLTHIFASLLSPSSGSMIIGKQLAIDNETGIRKWEFGNTVGQAWGYSVSAWKELWMGDKGPFRNSEVEAEVEEFVLPPGVGFMVSGDAKINITSILHWCITRL